MTNPSPGYKMTYRLICRSDTTEYRLSGKCYIEDVLISEFQIFRAFTWHEMNKKILLAKELFECDACEYENFSPVEGPTISSFNHPFFIKAPAMASLQTISEPKPMFVLV